MSKLGVFIDVGDQFFRIQKKWDSKKLNYQTYYNKAKEFGEIARAIAYGTQLNKSASKFMSCLHHIGFEPKYRDMEEGQWYNWSVGIAVDIMNLVNHNKIDIVVIGMSVKEIVPLVTNIKNKGIKVIVMGCTIHEELKEAADHWVELDISFLGQPELITETNNITN